MLKFTAFIIESLNTSSEEKLKHLEHLEDHAINAGQAGIVHAAKNLMDVHNKITGKHNNTRVTSKFDGSPSVIFGHHPENGKFFVASKSAFNKNPKINYSHEDIERNHGHAPGLVQKLKSALDHLPKVTPKHGVYQGDIMHTKGDVEVRNNKAHFTPNTITYSTPANSKHGKAALNSKIGVAVHTKYTGSDFEHMKAQYAPHITEFKSHKDVHLIPVEHDLSKVSYPSEDRKRFKTHLKNSIAAAKNIPAEGHEAVHEHQVPLKTYINHTVRTGSTPSFEGFKTHYQNSHQKKIDSVKTDKAKQQKTDNMNADMSHIHANKQHFENVLKVHKHLQKAKDILTHALSSHSDFEHHIKGVKSKPEGFVVVRNNRPTKFVDRSDFSASNFNK